MKKIKLLFFASVSTLVFCNPAFAEAFTIGSLVLGGVLSTTGVALAISPVIIGQLVLGLTTLGLNFVSQLARPRGSNPGDYKTEFTASETGAIRAVGRALISGAVAFGNDKEYDRDRIIWNSIGPLVGIEEIFLDKRSVSVEDNGAVSTPPWNRPNDQSYAYIKIKNVDSSETTTPWPELTTKYPAQWSENHIGKGVVQTYKKLISPGVSSTKFLKLYQKNSDPEVSILGRWGWFYDPRRLAYGWSDNGIIIAANTLIGDGSIGFNKIDWDKIALEADKADQLVTTKTGTEKRARISGVYSLTDKKLDVIQDMLDSIGAWIRLTPQGKIYIELINDNPSSEFTFSEEHIIELDGPARPEAIARENEVRISYYSSERNYELSEVNVASKNWAKNLSDAQNWSTKTYDLKLNFCPSHAQAQRIGRRMFAWKRARMGIVKFKSIGVMAYGRKIVTIPVPGTDLTFKALIGAPRIIQKNGSVEVPFTEIPTLPTWNPTEMEANPPDKISKDELVGEIPTPNKMTLAQLTREGQTGDAWQVRVAYTLPNEATFSTAQYRLYEDGFPLPWKKMSTRTSSQGNLKYAILNENLLGAKIDFRVMGLSDTGEWSNYSEPLSVNSLEISSANGSISGFSVLEIKNSNLDVIGYKLIGEDVRTESLNASYFTCEIKTAFNANYTQIALEAISPTMTLQYTSAQYNSYDVFRIRLYNSNNVIIQEILL